MSIIIIIIKIMIDFFSVHLERYVVTHFELAASMHS